MLLGDLESLRNACPLFRNLGDPSIDWERWRALIVTPVGDRAMRLSQTHESNWHETPCIKTVDLSCTHVADLPAGVLLCPECPHEYVRVFTNEKARQAHRSRANGHRAMASNAQMNSPQVDGVHRPRSSANVKGLLTATVPLKNHTIKAGRVRTDRRIDQRRTTKPTIYLPSQDRHMLSTTVSTRWWCWFCVSRAPVVRLSFLCGGFSHTVSFC